MNINDNTTDFRQRLTRIGAAPVIFDDISHEDVTVQVEEAIQNELVDTLVHLAGVLEIAAGEYITTDVDVWEDMDADTALLIHEILHTIDETDGLLSMDEETVECICAEILHHHDSDF